ncbi:glycosyl transferase [Patescibacteria group bacterium]|nr:MAG: glycosyl transferase [Patescibacteria group bacterium]
MHSNNPVAGVEHFVTLFDNNFLPIGLCLHSSLLEHGQPFHLWILCMDELVEQNLRCLALPHVSLISLREVEDARLLAAKQTRSRGEYCWTLTPFTPQFVFDRDTQVQRVTYLDADLFFFASPKLLLDEFEHSGKHVLITEHAYDPRYERFGRAKRGGRFCVQFMTFRRSSDSTKVMHWWQERCLEWCYARVEDGKFGDQKYLDQWPILFGPEVHILMQKEKTLAPWNVAYYEKLGHGQVAPVFYHFHGFRVLSHNELLLYSGYRVGNAANRLYEIYINVLDRTIAELKQANIAIPCLPRRDDLIGRLTTLKRQWIDGEKSLAYQS